MSVDMLQVSPSSDICVACDGKVYLIEKHIADGKLYHRSCFKRNNRKSDTSALTSPSSRVVDTPKPKKDDVPSVRAGLELSMSGLRKTSRPASSLPATPSTPEDTRPEWQRRIQDKSAARKNMFKTGLEPLSETDTGSNKSTPSGGASPARGASPVPVVGRKLTEPPKTETERVVLRNRTPPVTSQGGRGGAMPRAVSVGVDLDEKLNKLRQLRESGKANAAAKARLEKLKAVSAAGKESVSGSKENITSTAKKEGSPDRVTTTVKPEVAASTEPSKPTSLREVKQDAKQNGAMDVDVNPTEVQKEASNAQLSESEQAADVGEVQGAVNFEKDDKELKTVTEGADSDSSEAMSITEAGDETPTGETEVKVTDEEHKDIKPSAPEVNTPASVGNESSVGGAKIMEKKAVEIPSNPIEVDDNENIPNAREDNSNVNDVVIEKIEKPKSPTEARRVKHHGADGDKPSSDSSQKSEAMKLSRKVETPSANLPKEEKKREAKSGSSASSELSQNMSK